VGPIERSVDLNADLGEGGPADGALLEVVSSASVACGFHAGDPLTMVDTARRAAARGVAVGAHPSYPDRQGFGRRRVDLPADELYAIVVYQIGAMAAAAAAAGTSLRYVKPHGALYNRAAEDPLVAGPVVSAVASSGLPLLCPPGSQMQHAASRAGVECYAEAFADRAYAPDGRLAGRDFPGAVLDDPRQVAERAVTLVRTGRVAALDGSSVEVAADSICIHGDTPGALELAREVRRALEADGVSVRPFVTS
jgi:UPF0271 protein